MAKLDEFKNKKWTAKDDFPPEPIVHTLYRLRLNSTGEYYLGATKNIGRRESDHFLAIKKLIQSMIDHDYFQQRKTKYKTEFVPNSGQDVHYHFAKSILPGASIVGHRSRDNFIKNSYTIEVLKTTNDYADMKKWEDENLKGVKEDKLCLNSLYTSGYPCGSTKPIKQKIYEHNNGKRRK